MKALLILLPIMACTITAPFAYSDPILILLPETISGAPGDDVGWGFSFTSDSAGYYNVTSAFLINETNPGDGSFVDWISPQGGPVNAVLAPSTTWMQSYDPSQLFGIGQYSIDPAAPTGSDAGDMLVEYDIFSDDPNTCGSCYLDSGIVTAPFEVDVTSASPEPGSLALFALGLGAVLGFRRSAEKRKPA